MARSARTGEAETARARYSSLVDSLRRAHLALMVMGGVSTVSVLVAGLALFNQPDPQYFATDPEGRIMPLVPVSEPFLTDNQVSNFAVEAVTRSMTVSFSTWREDFTEASDYFEQPDGWNNFVDAIESSGMLDFVRNRRLNSLAVANGSVITREGIDATGRYSWTVQIPLVVTYESAAETSRDNLIAEVLIVRLPNWEVPRGVGIARINVRPGRA